MIDGFRSWLGSHIKKNTDIWLHTWSVMCSLGRTNEWYILIARARRRWKTIDGSWSFWPKEEVISYEYMTHTWWSPQLTFFSFMQKIIWQGTMPLSGYLKCKSPSRAKLVVYSKTCAVTGRSFTVFVIAPICQSIEMSAMRFVLLKITWPSW